MGIAKSTYYRKSFREEQQLEDDLILRDEIEKIHLDFPGYGYRRIREYLLREGVCVNGKRLRRIMKQYALFSAFKKLFGPRGKGIGKRLVFPNLIRGMELTGPNQLWSTDITYIKLKKEFVYLSAIMDVYTRKIVGWSVSRSMTHEFCLRSLEVAMKKQNPPPGVIHHSDRGTQYTCEQYVSFLEKHNFKISMSRVKTPEDNAFIESFFKSLKREEVFARNYESFEDVIKQLPRFIDQIYNTKRLHSSIGYQTPTEWETEVIKIKPAKRPVQKIWGWAV